MNSLVGTWKLVSFDVSKQKPFAPWRDTTSHGFLIYTSDGYMSAAINAEPSSLKKETDSKKVLQRSLFYAGKFEVKGNKVIHKVEVATNPSRIGKDLVREFTFEGDMLHLFADEDGVKSKVVWKRI